MPYFMEMARGIFITFEGGEGCGKSSHIAALRDYFLSVGKECVLTREPGGTPLAEKIRNILLDSEGENVCDKTEILLFEAARAQHVHALIKPALEAGKVVISDRFYDSTSAYQGAGRKLDALTVDFLNDFAASDVVPDITILLDLPPEIGLERARVRDCDKTDRMGSQKLSFYKDVRAQFLKIAAENPKRFAVIDSSGEKKETFAKILRAVKEKCHV